MKRLDISKKTLYGCLCDSAIKFPNNVAIYFDKHELNYNQLLKLVDDTSQWLTKRGIGQGDIVTLISHNSINFVVMFYAINKIGAIANIVHYGAGVSEIVKSLDMTKSRVVFTDRDDLIRNSLIKGRINFFINGDLEIKKINDLSKQHIREYCSVILYTSGSTGEPKGVMFDNIQFNEFAYQSSIFYPEVNEKFKMLIPIPLFHGFGLATGVHNTITTGGMILLLSKEDKDNIDVIFWKFKPNFVIGVPSFFEKLLINSKMGNIDLSSIRRVIVGGSKTQNNFEERLNIFLKKHGSNVKAQIGYGLTECLSGVTLNKQGDSIGVGLPFVNDFIRIEAEKNKVGEILIKGPTLMKGYLNQMSPIDEDGWLHTGDIGYMKDNYLFFVSRISRNVNTSGYLINLDYVENIILGCEGVDDVAVLAVTDRIKGFIPIAFVKTSSKTINEIVTYCQENMAIYSVPDIRIVKDLPLTPSGKKDYKELGRLYNL